MPRLGPDVPQWYGETIGFWDGEALITWTSNIQGWINARRVRVQQQAAVDRDLHAAQGRGRQARRHQARDRALRRRRVRRPRADRAELGPAGELNENDPFVDHGVHPADLPGQRPRDAGRARHDVRVHVPDIYGRPWAQIWEEYHEKGMSPPEKEDIFSFSEQWQQIDSSCVI